jgi:hypothetical protein
LVEEHISAWLIPGDEGEEMINFRLAVPAVLVAAAVAGCFTYFVTAPPPVEGDQRLAPTGPDLNGPDTGAPTNIDQRPSAEKQAAKAFKQAATAILRRAQYAQAAAGSNQLPITGHIPFEEAPDPAPMTQNVARRIQCVLNRALGRSRDPTFALENGRAWAHG